MSDDCLLADFNSAYPFSPKFQVDTHLSNFEGKKYISSTFLTCTSPIVTSLSMDTPEDISNIHDLSTPLVSLEESKESEECEGDASVHDHAHDDWYGYNVDEEDCIVEGTLLEESQFNYPTVNQGYLFN